VAASGPKRQAEKPIFWAVDRSVLNPFGARLYQQQSDVEHAMRNEPWLAALTLVLLVAAAPARTEDCPAETSQMDDIIVALNKTPSCDRAMKVFEACEYGASGDVQFGAVVEKKCESDFLAGLKTPKKQAYQRAMRGCDRKYQNESGTMYRSFTAFCRAMVAQRYSQQALKVADPPRVR
jgi:hypothetical protein